MEKSTCSINFLFTQNEWKVHLYGFIFWIFTDTTVNYKLPQKSHQNSVLLISVCAKLQYQPCHMKAPDSTSYIWNMRCSCLFKIIFDHLNLVSWHGLRCNFSLQYPVCRTRVFQLIGLHWSFSFLATATFHDLQFTWYFCLLDKHYFIAWEIFCFLGLPCNSKFLICRLTALLEFHLRMVQCLDGFFFKI